MPDQTPKARVVEEVHAHDQTFVPQRIICMPIDESEQSQHTVEFTIKTLVNKQTDQVILLHTRPAAFNDYSLELTGLPYILPSDEVEKVEQQLRTFSHNLLKETAQKFINAQIHVRAISLRGDAREEIEHKVGVLKPDIVVVGSRGLNTFSRVVLGSVSEYLIHHLKVPVMVVPMEPKTKKD